MILSLFIIICFLCAMEYSSFLSLIDADFWFVSRKWGVIIFDIAKIFASRRDSPTTNLKFTFSPLYFQPLKYPTSSKFFYNLFSEKIFLINLTHMTYPTYI